MMRPGVILSIELKITHKFHFCLQQRIWTAINCLLMVTAILVSPTSSFIETTTILHHRNKIAFITSSLRRFPSSYQTKTIECSSFYQNIILHKNVNIVTSNSFRRQQIHRCNNNNKNNLEQNNDDNNDVGDILVNRIEYIVNTALTPIKFLGNISLGIIFILMIQLLLQPLFQGILNVFLFTSFFVIGKKFIITELDDVDLYIESNMLTEKTIDDDDDDDNNTELLQIQIEFFSLIFSLFLSYLLAPESSSTTTSLILERNNTVDNILLIILFSIIGSGIYKTIQDIENDEKLSPDEKLMFRWDMKYNKDSKEKNKIKK